MATRASNKSLMETAGTQASPAANPYYKMGEAYQINCQTASLALECRRRGLEVVAGGYNALSERLSYDPTEGYRDKATGKAPEVLTYANKGPLTEQADYRELADSLKELMEPEERWALAWLWHGQEDGHIVNVERTKEGELVLIDGQSGEQAVGSFSFCGYFKDSAGVEEARVFKLSGMDINPTFKPLLRPCAG